MVARITIADWPFDERLNTLWRIADECRHKDPRAAVMAISEANRMLDDYGNSAPSVLKDEMLGDETGLYSAKALAKRWKCSERHVRNLIQKKALPSFRVGMLIRVNIADILDYERRLDRQSRDRNPPAPLTESKDQIQEKPKKRAARLDTAEIRARWKRMEERGHDRRSQ